MSDRFRVWSSRRLQLLPTSRLWFCESKSLESSCAPHCAELVSSLAASIHSFATMTAASKLPAHVAAQASKASPNLVREIFYGIGLGIFVGSFWKVHHLNERRKTEEFYSRLEAGEVTVNVEE